MSWWDRSRFAVLEVSDETDRMDFEWVDPRHKVMQEKLKQLAKKKGYKIDFLGKLCEEIFSGKTADQYVSSGIPIIKVRNVTSEGIDWNTDFVLREFFEENPDCHVRPLDVLVTCTGDGTIGRVDVMDKDTDVMIAVDTSALRVYRSKIHPSYLVHYLRSVFGQMQFDKHTVGSTGQTHLRDLNQFLVMYPSEIEDQVKIVGAAESHMIEAKRAKKEYEDVVEKAKIDFSEKTEKFRPSLWYSQVLSPSDRRFDFEYLDPRHQVMDQEIKALVRDKGLSADPLSSAEPLCEIFRGKTAGIYVTSGIPIIKLRNVTGEGIDWSTDFVLRTFYDENPDCHLRIGDVLLTSTGDGTIGRVDILEKDVPCMTDGHVTVLRVRQKEKLLPNYLAYYLRSVFARMQFERYTVGSTGQTELNEDDVAKVIVVFPSSLNEQEGLAKEARKHEERAVSAREEYRRHIGLSREEFARSLGMD